MTKYLTTAELYQRYAIPHNLAQHMLSTAGLGKLICTNWQKTALSDSTVDTQLVITTLLVHDLGNLVKFKLNNTSSLLKTKTLPQVQTQDLAYWQEKQQQMITKYGTDADAVNLKILQELGLSSAKKIMEFHTFEQLSALMSQPQYWAEKIVLYCDLRFTPFGLTTVKKRILDLQQRYRDYDAQWQDQQLVVQRILQAEQLETQLNNHINLDLKTVTMVEIQNLFPELLNLKIKVEV